jgi:hypothetical protein
MTFRQSLYLAGVFKQKRPEMAVDKGLSLWGTPIDSACK